MKNKIYSAQLIILSVTCILLFNTCKKDCSIPPPEVYNISATDKAKFLYTGTDTLKFTTNTYDTISFIGQGMNRYYSVLSGASPYQDCPSADQQYETYDITFLNPKGKDKLNCTFGGSLFDGLYFEIFNYSIYSGKFTGNTTGLRPPYDFTSLNINNIIYTDIKLFIPNEDYTDSFYYSTSSGIIRIKLATGQSFNRIKN